jgi:hypothetical protein
MLKTMPRGIPTSKVGLVMILGSALAPVIVRKLRPVAKKLGKGIIKLGKKIRDAAEEPHDPRKTSKER